jgi:O-antigen ligase
MLKKAVALPLIGLSFVYLLRTGSRGCLIGALAYGVLVFLFSRNKALVVALGLGAAAVGILANPSAPFSRLTTFDNVSTSAGLSTLQRKELFMRSIQETISHPLFGVGPGQFAVAVAGESEKRGEHASWLGTHNSYTHVSAECGVPALVCYCAVIVFCFILNYRMFAATRNNPTNARITALSFTFLSGIVVYSTTTMFFHMAYSGVLPILAGLTLALYFSAKSVLEPAS